MPGDQHADGQDDFEIAVDPTQIAGVWANWVWVTQSVHEFTLDFVRIDYWGRSGVVVARVAMSPLLVTRLLDALSAEWEKYQRRTLPPEVYPDDDERETGLQGS